MWLALIRDAKDSKTEMEDAIPLDESTIKQTVTANRMLEWKYEHERFSRTCSFENLIKQSKNSVW